jgi:hypothetical protein
MNNYSLINPAFELKKAKMITGEDVEVTSKLFVCYEIRISLLEGEMISFEPKTPQQFAPYCSDIINLVSNLLKESNFDDNLKQRWWHCGNLKLLLIDNTDANKKIFIQDPQINFKCITRCAIEKGDVVTINKIKDIKDVLFCEQQIDISKIDKNSKMYFVSIINNIAYIFVDLNADGNLTLNSNKDCISKVFRYQIWHEFYFNKRYNIPSDWFAFLEIISDLASNTYDNFEDFILEKMDK